MMKITAKQGKQNKIHIYIDDNYLTTVDDTFWFSCGYVSGDNIDIQELEAFKTAAGSRRAFNAALSFISRREHSSYELKQKLLRKFDEEDIEAAITRLEELDMVNDERFAQMYANELFEHKKFGISRIKNELYRKGIAREIIDDTTENLKFETQEDNIQRIVDIISKKYYNKINDEKSRQRVFNSLVRLGYGYSDIKSAMREYDESEFYDESC